MNEERKERGEMNTEEVMSIPIKFMFMRSNVYINNLKVSEDIATTEEPYNPHFKFYHSPYHTF
jgi:hypothetical protein